jgi:hypothetical protein
MRYAIQLFSRWLSLLPLIACMLGAGMVRGADETALELTILIPHSAKKLPEIPITGKLVGKKPIFQVVLHNVSGKPQRIRCDSFPVVELTNAAGEKWTALPRQSGSMQMGMDGVNMLQADGKVIFDVYPMPRNDLTDALWFPSGLPRGRVTVWATMPVIGSGIWQDSLMARPVTCVVE